MSLIYIKEARNSFLDLGVYLLKSNFRIEDIPSHNNKKLSSSELLPGDPFPLFFKY